MQSIAIIGSGISGLGCAWFLQRENQITVFEAGSHVGGHANTVTVDEGTRRVPVDTGFMVFNHVTYPNLLRLFRALDVPMKPTDMSFSVHHAPRGLEYRGTSLNHLFAQRRNLLRPAFYRLLRQIDRFNGEAVEALRGGIGEATIAEYVAARGYGEDFLHLYLVPMGSAVWSTPPARMLEFPAATLLQFFHNHGFLGLHTQHPWWTIEGGSRVYVERMITGFRDRIWMQTPVRAVRRFGGRVEVVTDTAAHLFDQVIFACHPPTTLQILGEDATPSERAALSPIRYHPNIATLHRDRRVMPNRRLAWSAWNYRLTAGDAPARVGAARAGASPLPLQASTHYWMNRLQGVSDRHDYFVSINGEAAVDPGSVIETFDYEHPLFDTRARRAQPLFAGVNALGKLGTNTFFVGAWQRYGFHEDGFTSAIDLCRQLLRRDPWIEPRVVNVA